MGRNQFAVLGLMPGASGDDIKKAFRSLARQYHPDKNNHPGAEEKFKKICAAYEFLKEDDNRLRHEKDLRHNFDFNRKNRKEHFRKHDYHYTDGSNNTENKENSRESSFNWDGFSRMPKSSERYRNPHQEKRSQRSKAYAWDEQEIPSFHRRKHGRENDKEKTRSFYDNVPDDSNTPRNERRENRHGRSDKERFIPNFIFDDFSAFFSEPFKSMEEDFGCFFCKRDPFDEMHHSFGVSDSLFDSVFDELLHDFPLFDMRPKPTTNDFHFCSNSFGQGENKASSGHRTHFDSARKRRPAGRSSSFRFRRDPFRDTL